MKLSQPYPLDLLCSLMDGTKHDPALAGVVVDALDDAGMCQTNRPEIMVDVCLLYARDRGACEGLTERRDIITTQLPDETFSEALPGESVYGHARGVLMRLAPLLPTDFPQAVFAEWAARCWAVTIPELKTVVIPQWSNVRIDQPIPEPAWRVDQVGMSLIGQLGRIHPTKPPAVREMKRRTLKMVPVVWEEYKSGWIVNRIPPPAFVPEEPQRLISASWDVSPQDIQANLRDLNRPYGYH